MSDTKGGLRLGQPCCTDDRAVTVQHGRRLEYVTVLLALLEALPSIDAGILAGSVALLGFGFDSLIEMVSGAAVLWRLKHDADPMRREHAERITLKIVGLCFLLLAAYVLCLSLRSLLLQDKPRGSILGIVVAAFSFVAMIVLARAKRKVATQLTSAAMNADALQTALCSYLSAITLAGVLLNVLLGWWGADPIAALAMVPIITKEGVDALRGMGCCDC
jgi:divalent metal cation (Fe/Co/Zn/Cd) transporter